MSMLLLCSFCFSFVGFLVAARGQDMGRNVASPGGKVMLQAPVALVAIAEAREVGAEAVPVGPRRPVRGAELLDDGLSV